MSDNEQRAIEAFNMADAAEALKTKLKNAFVEMIPEEQWEKLLKDEFDKFVNPRKVKDQYSREWKEVPSGLSELCQEILRDMAKDKLKEELKDPKWSTHWGYDENQSIISCAIKEYLEDHQEELVRVAVREFMGSTFQNLIDQMKRGY